MLEKRHVFVEELFLQILGTRGDDDALAGADHGQQIGESFAGTGAGFKDQVPLFRERLFDGLRHLQLAAPEFVGGMSLREHAPGGKEIVERDVSLVRAGVAGGRGLGRGRHGVSIIAARGGLMDQA